MDTKKALAVSVAIAFVGALIPALAVLKMMADNNNNNGELYDTITGQWDIGYPNDARAH